MGNISFSAVTRKIVKCDLCGGTPSCAKACLTGAIWYEDATTSNIGKKKVIADKFKDLFTEVKKQ